nr:MAG TPA: Blasticidin M [Caudoviricetes sp.]
MAHPFGGSFENQIRARNLARSLTKEYPEVTFINPLDNFIYMDRRNEEEILAAERCILAKCELLLLTGSCHKSRGCLSEKNYAETRGMPIAQLTEDRTLRWVRQEKS